MKFKVKKKGLYDTAGPIEIDRVLSVKKVPDSWKHFGDVIEESSTSGKEAVTNPDDGAIKAAAEAAKKAAVEKAAADAAKKAAEDKGAK